MADPGKSVIDAKEQTKRLRDATKKFKLMKGQMLKKVKEEEDLNHKT
jgi:hypothetical protein